MSTASRVFIVFLWVAVIALVPVLAEAGPAFSDKTDDMTGERTTSVYAYTEKWTAKLMVTCDGKRLSVGLSSARDRFSEGAVIGGDALFRFDEETIKFRVEVLGGYAHFPQEKKFIRAIRGAKTLRLWMMYTDPPSFDSWDFDFNVDGFYELLPKLHCKVPGLVNAPGAAKKGTK